MPDPGHDITGQIEQDLFDRIGKMERVVSAQSRDITHLDASMKALAAKMDSGFQALSSSITSQKTPIASLASWATVVMVLVGAILWPQITTDKRHDLVIEKMAKSVSNHLAAIGHPTLATRIDHLEMTHSAAAVELQREMRDLDAAINAKLDGISRHSVELNKNQQRQIAQIYGWFGPPPPMTLEGQ